jgi:pimeloyl-ACP methyl ester carboxylesterase
LWLAACVIATPFLLFFAARGAIALATDVLESRYPPPGKMIAVDGHKMHIYCVGDGAPTVVLEPGMGTDWVQWRPVSSKLSTVTRVCVYDRAGYAWSDPGPTPRSALRIATELHELLSKASVPGPYLLIAHSFGGYIARMYAARFPDSLSGIVMVDSLQEEDGHAPNPKPPAGFGFRGLVSLLPPIGSDRLKRLYQGSRALPASLKDAPVAYQYRFLMASPLRQLKAERNEFESLPLTEEEVRAARFPPELPLVVITAGADEKHWARQTRLARLSLSGKQVIAASSGHSVELFQPDLIVDAVEQMLKRSR